MDFIDGPLVVDQLVIRRVLLDPVVVALPDGQLQHRILLIDVVDRLSLERRTVKDDSDVWALQQPAQDPVEPLVYARCVAVDDRRQAPTIQDDEVAHQPQPEEDRPLEDELVEELDELEDVRVRLCLPVPQHPVDERVRDAVTEWDLNEGHPPAIPAKRVCQVIRLRRFSHLITPFKGNQFTLAH